MDPHSDASPLPPSRRRWRIPAPPTPLPGAPGEARVLEEVSGELGLALWQALRDVALWASCPGSARARLFAPGAERSRLGPVLAVVAHRELEGPLGTLSALVARPATARAEVVALACRQLSQWADERGALATALAFSESAAAVTPGDAGAAFAAGRLALRRAQHARAEAWYLRAAGLGRQGGDWSSYTSAMLGLGHLQRQRGELRVAERRYLRSLRAAQRNGLREAQAQALHFLFVVAAEGGHPPRAEGYAREALRAYGAGHPNLPRLAHDLAYLWLLQGLFVRSLTVFEALLPHFPGPVEHLIVLGGIGRAAGGAGRRERFESAWGKATWLAHSPAAAESAAPSVLDLAHGAWSLGDRARAEEAARWALRVATSRGDAASQRGAEMLLGVLASTAEASVEHPVPDPLREDDTLVADLLESLSACALAGGGMAVAG